MWATCEETCNALGIGRTALWSLQKTQLQPGKHWVYLTGKAKGVIGWDIKAIAEWQREETAAIAKQQHSKAAAIETYQEEGQVNG